MFNAINETVTCDVCRKSIPAESSFRERAITAVEKKDWLYSGIGQFWCPKCKGKKK